MANELGASSKRDYLPRQFYDFEVAGMRALGSYLRAFRAYHDYLFPGHYGASFRKWLRYLNHQKISHRDLTNGDLQRCEAAGYSLVVKNREMPICRAHRPTLEAISSLKDPLGKRQQPLRVENMIELESGAFRLSPGSQFRTIRDLISPEQLREISEKFDLDNFDRLEISAGRIFGKRLRAVESLGIPEINLIDAVRYTLLRDSIVLFLADANPRKQYETDKLQDYLTQLTSRSDWFDWGVQFNESDIIRVTEMLQTSSYYVCWWELASVTIPKYWEFDYHTQKRIYDQDRNLP